MSTSPPNTPISSQPQPPPVSRSTVFHHVGRLPPSFFSLLPNLPPSAMLAVLPDRLLRPAQLQHATIHQVAHRLATIYSADRLLNQPHTDNPHAQHHHFPPVVLLSACLHAALAPEHLHPLTITALPTAPASLLAVTLTPLLPTPFPSSHISLAATLTKPALLHRDALAPDIIPVSNTLWLVVQSTKASSTHPAIVTTSTHISILPPRSSPPRAPTLPSIPPSLRAAVAAKCLPPPCWALSAFARPLSQALRTRHGMLVLVGKRSDLRDCLQRATLALPTFHISQPSPRHLTHAFAMAELASTHPLIILDLPSIPSALVNPILHALARHRHPLAHWRLASPVRPALIVVLCQRHDDLPVRLQRVVDDVFIIPHADVVERAAILRNTIADHGVHVVQNELDELLRCTATFARAEVHGVAHVFARGGIAACRDAVALFDGARLAVDAGGVRWRDVGGLEDARRQIVELVSLSAAMPDVRSGQEDIAQMARRSTRSKRRVGVLLYGPPGTGKTLLARAVAGECEASFISVKGPELLNMYVGESERNVREVFERAKTNAPCVIFFDEVDALVPNRGGASDSGAVSDRVVSQMLAEMDEVAACNDVFVIAASNRPDLVDAGLLRPGRLDKLIYVPMPGSREEQAKILRAQTRKFAFEEDVNLEEVLEMAPQPGLVSGADLNSLAASAWMNAAKRVIKKTKGNQTNLKDNSKSSHQSICARRLLRHVKVVKGLDKKFSEMFVSDQAKQEDRPDEDVDEEEDEGSSASPVKVAQEDLITAAQELKPSLTSQQLFEYELLRQRIEGNA